MITSLKENQIFVFGSNANWSHWWWAAYQAKTQFGAEDWVWEWITWQCYAFPNDIDKWNTFYENELWSKIRQILTKHLWEGKWEQKEGKCWTESNPHKAKWNVVIDTKPQQIYCEKCEQFIEIDKDTIFHKPKKAKK